jgi:hypothetical protein
MMPPSGIRQVNRRVLVGVGRAAMAMSQERPWNAPSLYIIHMKHNSELPGLFVSMEREEAIPAS